MGLFENKNIYIIDFFGGGGGIPLGNILQTILFYSQPKKVWQRRFGKTWLNDFWVN